MIIVQILGSHNCCFKDSADIGQVWVSPGSSLKDPVFLLLFVALLKHAPTIGPSRRPQTFLFGLIRRCSKKKSFCVASYILYPVQLSVV